MARRLITTGILLVLGLPAWAGEADVIGARFDRRPSGEYDFDVTIRSRDTGWDRYADRIEILAADGKVLATRVLDHPHEHEQPFTRDVYGVRIPAGVDRVTVRAHFKPVGFDGDTLVVTLRGK